VVLDDAVRLPDSNDQLDRLYAIGLVRQSLLAGKVISPDLTSIRQRGVNILIDLLRTSPSDSNLTAYAAAEALSGAGE
jgi:hypothetical protein